MTVNKIQKFIIVVFLANFLWVPSAFSAKYAEIIQKYSKDKCDKKKGNTLEGEYINFMGPPLNAVEIQKVLKRDLSLSDEPIDLYKYANVEKKCQPVYRGETPKEEVSPPQDSTNSNIWGF